MSWKVTVTDRTTKQSTSLSGKGKVLHYERDYKVKTVELPAEKAAEFHKLEGTILADEKATVVLKKAPVAGTPVASGSTPQ